MEVGGWVVLILSVTPFFATLGLMFARYRRIRRYGRHGGEYNDPFATAGRGGMLPGTVFQQDFGGTGTSQSWEATGEPERPRPSAAGDDSARSDRQGHPRRSAEREQ